MEGRDAEVTRLHQHVDQRDQHEHGAQERVQEELERGVHTPRTAPHADDEEHRNEHGFPEEIEQQAVERGEHANHQSFHDEEGGVVLRGTLFDHSPCRDHHRDGDEGGQQDQRQRDAVDAERVRGVERRNPRQVFRELIREARDIEAAIQRNRRDECRDGDGERDPAPCPDAAFAECQHEQAARDGQPGQKRKNRKPLHVCSLLLDQARVTNQPSMTASPVTIQNA